jgi:hypothetical protein
MLEYAGNEINLNGMYSVGICVKCIYKCTCILHVYILICYFISFFFLLATKLLLKLYQLLKITLK